MSVVFYESAVNVGAGAVSAETVASSVTPGLLPPSSSTSSVAGAVSSETAAYSALREGYADCSQPMAKRSLPSTK